MAPERSTGWPQKAPTDSRCSMQFHKPQRQPIAVVSPFVMHVTGKAMHQVDSEIADFRLLERLCHRWGRELGRIKFPAAILNAGDQRSCIALQLDRNPQAVVLCAAAVTNDVGDSFLKAKLNCERGVGRQLLMGLVLEPS